MKRSYRLISAVLLIASLVSIFSVSAFALTSIDLRNYPYNGNYFITTGFWDFMGYGGLDGVFWDTTKGPYLSFAHFGLNTSHFFKSIYIASDIDPDDVLPSPSDFTLKGEILYSGFTFDSLRISVNNGLTYSAVTNFHTVDNCLSFSLDFSGISNFTGINIMASVTLLRDPSDSTKYQDFRFFGTSLKMVDHDFEKIESYTWDPKADYNINMPSKNTVLDGGLIYSDDAEHLYQSGDPVINGTYNSGAIFSTPEINSRTWSYCISPNISDSFRSSYCVDGQTLHYNFPFRVLGDLVDISPVYLSDNGYITPLKCDVNIFEVDSSAYDFNNTAQYNAYTVQGSQYVLTPVYFDNGEFAGYYDLTRQPSFDKDIAVYYNDYNYDLTRNTLGVISFSAPADVNICLYVTTALGSSASSGSFVLTDGTVSASYDLSMSESEKMWVDLIEKNFDAFIVYLDSVATSLNLSHQYLLSIQNNAANIYRILQTIDSKFDVQLANEEQMLAYLQTISDNLVPDQQQMEQFRDDKAGLDSSLSSISDAESIMKGDVDSALADVPDFASGLSSLGASFLFISGIADLAFSSLGDFGIVFIFPLFLGTFFFLCSRVPGVVLWFTDRAPTDKSDGGKKITYKALPPGKSNGGKKK